MATIIYTISVSPATNDYGYGNKYHVDSITSPNLTLSADNIYRFDLSHSTNSGHPLRFSTTANGTHSGGVEYTQNVSVMGVPGTPGSYVQISVDNDTPSLSYYCKNHSGMGAEGKLSLFPAAAAAGVSLGLVLALS